MADSTKTVFSVIATTSERLSDLEIVNGHLIFIQDIGRIAFDFNDTRVFYNQIIELETDSDREAIESPINGMYYFVIGTAVLWTYQNEWIQITTQPKDVVVFGAENPSLGSENTLYVDMTEKSISYWDNDSQGYEVVGNRTENISSEDIAALFN